MPVSIPELAPGSPLLQALPEFKSLENYGGATIEANIQAATTRFKLFNKAIDDVKLKITALNNRSNAILGSDWQVSDTFSLGEDISEDDILSLRATLRNSSNTELRDTYRTFLGLRSGEAIGGQPKNIARLIQFLRSDDPNVPISEMVESSLRKGIKFTPKTNRNGVGSVATSVGDILVPFKLDNGVIVPAVDLSGYRQALTTLNDFRMQNTFPSNLNPKKISIRISATQADFEADFEAVSRTNRDLSNTQGANITLRPDGNPVTRSQDINGTIDDKTSVILINHELNETTPGEFGGENSVAETVLHEYGHSIHRSMGIGWGDPSSANPAYSTVRGQEVSAYGDNNDQEHFSETFAKYMLTGDATPEFKSFLEDQVGIKKFDLDAAFPAWLRGNAARDQFIAKMGAADLGGFKIEVESFSNPYSNYTTNQLAEIAQRTIDTGSYDPVSMSLRGNVLDSSDRKVGNFTRTINRGADGKLWVYHNYFEMNGSAQGGGFGTSFIEASFDLYREWGAEYVDVTAALSNGPYMWALRGFDFKNQADKTRRKALVEDYLNILTEYSSNEQEMSSLLPGDASTKIKEALNAKGIALNNRNISLTDIVQKLRAYGWIVDAELLAQMRNVVNTPTRAVTANMIAVIGQTKRRTRSKSSSSIGRMIMMVSSWSGRKKL